MKFITSHDVITARNLYEEPFDFTPTHKTVLTTNYKPIVKGTDEGIWRRLHLVPFTVAIAKADQEKNFRERRLLPELSGILNWALGGLHDYQNGGLKPPTRVTEATREYRKDMDLVGRWIEDRCIEDHRVWATTKELYRDYAAWALRRSDSRRRPSRSRATSERWDTSPGQGGQGQGEDLPRPRPRPREDTRRRVRPRVRLRGGAVGESLLSLWDHMDQMETVFVQSF